MGCSSFAPSRRSWILEEIVIRWESRGPSSRLWEVSSIKYQVSSIDQVKQEIRSGGWPVQKRDRIRKLLRLRSWSGQERYWQGVWIWLSCWTCRGSNREAAVPEEVSSGAVVNDPWKLNSSKQQTGPQGVVQVVRLLPACWYFCWDGIRFGGFGWGRDIRAKKSSTRKVTEQSV